QVLLMGRSNAGKTSMRSIIFANYIARETTRLGYTQDVEHSHVKFLGNLVLNLWDCGGQEAYMESYFESQRDHIFRNAAVLIYVFDIESQQLEKDIQYFTLCIEALKSNSDNAKVFCLVHKMDLVPEESREEVFAKQVATVKEIAGPLDTTCFQTSIWDETLYHAWSKIVYSLIPNVQALEQQLAAFCEMCGADEVVLFERATFLVISHATRKPFKDVHRFEKVSNIIKQFKLSCSKSQSQFCSMQVRNSAFSAIIEGFTATTYIMVVTSDPTALPAITSLNISNAREHFEKMNVGLG
ncbi:rraga protein, partial [Baffinella frigidus]